MIQDIWTLIIVLISSTHYISNRYLVAKLIEVLFMVNPRVQPMFHKISDNILQNPLGFDHLVPSLMKFYSGTLIILLFLYETVELLCFFFISMQFN